MTMLPEYTSKLGERSVSISGRLGDRKERGDAREEIALVVRARGRDRAAFELLYRRYFAHVFRLARFYLGSDADDAVAETFVRAWAGLPRYRDTGAPFVAWLYAIARNVVRDEIARRRRVQPRSGDLPDGAVDWSEDDRLAIAAAISKLSGSERRVIELKFLAGLRNPEVSAALGISIAAVNSRQWRALRTLRAMLEET
jgi:RNA polymerase sigma-70 factor (ECF subfamily)